MTGAHPRYVWNDGLFSASSFWLFQKEQSSPERDIVNPFFYQMLQLVSFRPFPSDIINSPSRVGRKNVTDGPGGGRAGGGIDRTFRRNEMLYDVGTTLLTKTYVDCPEKDDRLWNCQWCLIQIYHSYHYANRSLEIPTNNLTHKSVLYFKK